jgi:hypothetical protein
LTPSSPARAPRPDHNERTVIWYDPIALSLCKLGDPFWDNRPGPRFIISLSRYSCIGQVLIAGAVQLGGTVVRYDVYPSRRLRTAGRWAEAKQHLRESCVWIDPVFAAIVSSEFRCPSFQSSVPTQRTSFLFPKFNAEAANHGENFGEKMSDRWRPTSWW